MDPVARGYIYGAPGPSSVDGAVVTCANPSLDEFARLFEFLFGGVGILRKKLQRRVLPRPQLFIGEGGSVNVSVERHALFAVAIVHRRPWDIDTGIIRPARGWNAHGGWTLCKGKRLDELKIFDNFVSSNPLVMLRAVPLQHRAGIGRADPDSTSSEVFIQLMTLNVVSVLVLDTRETQPAGVNVVEIAARH